MYLMSNKIQECVVSWKETSGPFSATQHSVNTREDHINVAFR